MRIPVLAITLVLAATARGAELEQHEVPARAGPLLTFVAYDDGPRGRISEHHLFQPGDKSPQVFLRHNGNISWYTRVGADVLVGKSHQTPRGLYAFDLTKGTHRVLVPEPSTNFVGSEGSEIYVVTGHRDAAQQLFAIDAIDPDYGRTLIDRPLERVFRTSTPEFYAVPIGPERELWRVPRDAGGKPRPVCAIDPEWNLNLLTITHSPSGRLVALGAAAKKDSFQCRDLLVVDVDTGKVELELPRIPVPVSRLSSSMPRLRTRFVDERTVRFSETVVAKREDGSSIEGAFRWVDVDVATGKRLRETEYASGGLQHLEPPAGEPVAGPQPERWEEGGFDRSHGRLYLRGAEEPLIDFRHAERPEQLQPHQLQLSADGRWAATMLTSERVLRLHDARSRRSIDLFPRWVHSVRWWASD